MGYTESGGVSPGQVIEGYTIEYEKEALRRLEDDYF